jgi:hypothetical protein
MFGFGNAKAPAQSRTASPRRQASLTGRAPSHEGVAGETVGLRRPRRRVGLRGRRRSAHGADVLYVCPRFNGCSVGEGMTCVEGSAWRSGGSPRIEPGARSRRVSSLPFAEGLAAEVREALEPFASPSRSRMTQARSCTGPRVLVTRGRRLAGPLAPSSPQPARATARALDCSEAHPAHPAAAYSAAPNRPLMRNGGIRRIDPEIEFSCFVA